MNKERRENLAEVESTIDEAIDQIQNIIDEEQDAFDNLPDPFQDSDRGAKMEEAIIDMEELIDKLRTVSNEIESVVKKHTPVKKTKTKMIRLNPTIE